MISSSSPSVGKTIIIFNGKIFCGFHFNGQCQSLDSIRPLINQAMDGCAPKSYRIQIEDEDEYFELTDYYLQHNCPWTIDECGEQILIPKKKVKLRIIETAPGHLAGYS